MRPSVLALAAGCSLASGFDVSYQVPELTIPGNPVAHAAEQPLATTVPPFAISIDSDQWQQQSQLSGVVSSVRLASLSFTITGDSGCFDFVDTVTLTITSRKVGSALQPATVATGTGQGCVQNFALTPATLNIKPYLDEGASIRAAGSGVPPASKVTFDGQFTLHATL
jgi:hypothetical protein